MVEKTKKSLTFQEIFAFILPSFIILSQWISVAGINLSWCLYVLLFGIIFLRYKMLFKHAGILTVAGAIAFFPILTYVFGIAPSYNVSLYFSIMTGLVVFLLIFIMSNNEYDAFMWGVVFSCVLFALWGIYEVFTGHYILFSNEALFRANWVGLHYPGVAFANTNDLVQYLVLLYPISAYLLLKKNKVIFGFLTIAVVFVTFQADSRLGMIAICAILCIAFVISMFTSGRTVKIGKMLLLGLFIVIALWIYDVRTGVVSSIFENFLVVDTNADYYTGRGDIYKPLIQFAFYHPFGGFGSAYLATENVPHNLMLYILCDYGWIPCLAAVIFIVKMTLFGAKKAKEQGGDAFWCLLLAAMCLFIVTSSISSSNEQRKAVWMFLGICARNVYNVSHGGGEILKGKWVRLSLGKNVGGRA